MPARAESTSGTWRSAIAQVEPKDSFTKRRIGDRGNVSERQAIQYKTRFVEALAGADACAIPERDLHRKKRPKLLVGRSSGPSRM